MTCPHIMFDALPLPRGKVPLRPEPHVGSSQAGEESGSKMESNDMAIGGGENVEWAEFGMGKCGTTKLYHISPWDLRTKASGLGAIRKE